MSYFLRYANVGFIPYFCIVVLCMYLTVYSFCFLSSPVRCWLQCEALLLSNVSLERFFNQLKIVKTEQCTTPSEKSLNSIPHIRLRGNSVTEFNNMYSYSVLQHSQKPRRIHQKRRKEYRKKEICEKVACLF